MRALLVIQNYPPEVNAPAARASALARAWTEGDGSVEVLTGVPCHPDGMLAPGYRNRFTRGREEGVEVTRVPHLTLPNRGAVRRLLLYTSFFVSAVAHGWRLQRRPDVVVATSPHLLAGLAGLLLARLHRVPFVLEVRDLWPESVVASDVLPEGHPVVRLAHRLADLLYREAAHIVTVTRAFGRELEGRGVPPAKITFLPNGADLESFGRPPSDSAAGDVRRAHGLDGHFVASYIGTVGKAHRADVLHEAARLSEDPDLVFMVVGPGAERPALERLQRERPLPNFRLVDKQPRERIPAYLAASDVSVVHLKDRPLFRAVIPSKIFEAMAAGNPIVLGVRGEARELVEEAGAGLAVEPESPRAILEAVRRLRDDAALRKRLSENGRRAARERFDRRVVAGRYWELLDRIVREEGERG